MAVEVKGLDSLLRELDDLRVKITDLKPITAELARLMTVYVHVRSGYLRSTISHEAGRAIAMAGYAEVEEERGGEHAFAAKATEAFDPEKYADHIWKAFR